MNERRALVVVLALGGILVTWAAARYARQVESRQPASEVAAAAKPRIGTATGSGTDEPAAARAWPRWK